MTIVPRTGWLALLFPGFHLASRVSGELLVPGALTLALDYWERLSRQAWTFVSRALGVPEEAVAPYHALFTMAAILLALIARRWRVFRQAPEPRGPWEHTNFAFIGPTCVIAYVAVFQLDLLQATPTPTLLRWAALWVLLALGIVVGQRVTVEQTIAWHERKRERFGPVASVPIALPMLVYLGVVLAGLVTAVAALLGHDALLPGFTDDGRVSPRGWAIVAVPIATAVTTAVFVRWDVPNWRWTTRLSTTVWLVLLGAGILAALVGPSIQADAPSGWWAEAFVVGLAQGGLGFALIVVLWLDWTIIPRSMLIASALLAADAALHHVKQALAGA